MRLAALIRGWQQCINHTQVAMFCALQFCVLSVLLVRNSDLKIWSRFYLRKLQDLFTVISRGYFVK